LFYTIHWPGLLEKMAACMFTDMTMTTQRGEVLSEENVKSLLDVSEGGSIQAREFNVTFPPKMPRVFATNGDFYLYTHTSSVGIWGIM